MVKNCLGDKNTMTDSLDHQTRVPIAAKGLQNSTMSRVICFYRLYLSSWKLLAR